MVAKCLAIALILAPFLYAQSTVISSGSIQAPDDPRWHVRRDAFERLAAIPDGVSQPRVRSLLISLLEKENRASESGEPESGEPDLFEDDDYVAYDEALSDLVEGIAERRNDSRAWKALVYGRYNGDSVFRKWLADHSSHTLPFLSQQLSSPFLVRCATAVYVVALCLAKMPAFPASKLLKDRVRHLASHAEAPENQYAMQGIASWRGPADVPLLTHLSKTAASRYTRATALQALQSLQAKPKQPSLASSRCHRAGMQPGSRCGFLTADWAE